LNVEEGDLVGFEFWVGFQRFLQGFYGVVSVGYDFCLCVGLRVFLCISRILVGLCVELDTRFWA